MNCAVHPERAAVQPCDRCGSFGCAECLSRVGSVQFCGSCRGRASELEWDRRRELGLMRAWWLTSRRLIVSPLQTLDVVSAEGTIVESSIYAGLCTLAGFIPTLLLYALFFGAAMAFAAARSEELPKGLGILAGTGAGVAIVVLYLFMLVAGSVLFVLFSAAVELLILRMAGAREARYSVAVRAHALSMAPYVVGVLPLCSLYVFPVWALVLRVFAIQKLHRVTAGKGAASALIPVGVCCFGFLGVYGVAIAVVGLAAGR